MNTAATAADQIRNEFFLVMNDYFEGFALHSQANPDQAWKKLKNFIDQHPEYRSVVLTQLNYTGSNEIDEYLRKPAV